MNIKVVEGDITKHPGSAIVINLFEGVTSPKGTTGMVDDAVSGAITEFIADKEIKGSKGEMHLVHALGSQRSGRLGSKRVLVVGLGPNERLDLDAVRSVTAESARLLRSKGITAFATVAHGTGTGGLDTRSLGRAMAEGLILGLYRFEKYKKPSENQQDIEEVIIVEADASKIAELRAGVEDGLAIANATNLARDMVNEPANHMTPDHMAAVARDVAISSELEIEVFDRNKMQEFGMGALLGVAQGSSEPPRFIILRYCGDPDNPANNLGLLGKGITFDSGGISLKPSAKMGEMKGDMAGGASVIAAMKAIGYFKPRINIVGLVAATENLPGGRAQRPGDIVRAMNGKTIEIENTDAEGRLVLADAASYATSIGITRIVDVATLTGAIIVALGHHYTGAFGNNKNLIDSVIDGGKMAGERIWHLPIDDDYVKQYKSDIADMKNIGGRPAGATTGAMLIGEFVQDAAWVHLDVAGTAWSDTSAGWHIKGGTGVPTSTLVHLALALAAG